MTRPHAVEIVKEFIKTNLPPETYIGIFNLNETLIPVHEFTKNREELLQSTFSDGQPWISPEPRKLCSPPARTS